MKKLMRTVDDFIKEEIEGMLGDYKSGKLKKETIDIYFRDLSEKGYNLTLYKQKYFSLMRTKLKLNSLERHNYNSRNGKTLENKL